MMFSSELKNLALNYQAFDKPDTLLLYQIKLVFAEPVLKSCEKFLKDGRFSKTTKNCSLKTEGYKGTVQTGIPNVRG